MPGLDRQGWHLAPWRREHCIVTTNPSPDRPAGPVIVTVCTSCRAPGTELAEAPGRKLFEAVASAAEGTDCRVRPTQCLSVCKRICSVSLSAAGGYTFVFGDLDPDRDAGDVVAMARACAEAPHGFVPWRDRPEAMRRGIIARVPPPDWSPEDGSAPG